MSATRAVSCGLPGLSRATVRCLRGHFATGPVTQSRSLSSKAPTTARSLPSGTSSTTRSLWWLCEISQSAFHSPAQRTFSSTSAVAHGDWSPPKPGEELVKPGFIHICKQTLTKLRLYVTFVDKDGDEHKIAVSKGDNLLDIAQANDIEMEGQRHTHLSTPPGHQLTGT
jgi:hypothetical protein